MADDPSRIHGWHLKFCGPLRTNENAVDVETDRALWMLEMNNGWVVRLFPKYVESSCLTRVLGY